jgi:outer membrane assembly lipoprotein YfgL
VNISFSNRHQALRLMLLCLAGLLLAACSGPERAKPVDLGPNPGLIGVRSVWKSSIGAVSFPLDIRSIGNSLFVAGSDGVVAEIDARTGGDVWRLDLATKLTAGVGSDGRYAAVVSRSNDLILLSAGREIWRQKLNALTLTAPLVAGARVFVLSADRTTTALDAATGRKLWQQQRSGDALVLGQAGILMAIGDTLVSGQGGRLVGMNPQNGSIRWDSMVASSRGTNDVERLVDLVAGVSRDADQVCMRAFQSAVGCVDGAKGGVLWSKPSVGATGLGGDGTAVFGTESDGKIQAWRRSDGERLWTSERLKYRYLTSPTLIGRSIAIGDEAGNVHFVSRQDGSLLNRVATDGSPLHVTPVVNGQTLVVVTQKGGVFGFRPE